MSTRNEVYKLLAIKTEINDIVDILQVSRRTVERYAKEYSDTLATKDKKATTTSDRKRRKEIARAHIETGSSIKEAKALSGTTTDICKKLSSKERLQEKQTDFLRRLREEHKEMILQNKRDRLEINTRIKADLAVSKSNKQTQEMLLMNEKTEQTILESERLDRLERFEFEKEVHKSKLKLEMLEKIEQMSDKELEELQKFLEKKETFVNAE
ncbi:hypothetical protein [Fusobacterium necrophorum]|uniref:hypothetical protein n=1 Tax=Fusobacterium necrophorum TaxID=859 RepID=UPI00078784D0|nr:hypothetical protein [Fusobacterium necrophorum]AYV94920.1 hypothetical protein BWX37_04500 [Fusobacterium necrophorum subsp. funduliforme]AYV95962.1 hypothetical protein BWX37_10150 [Fusobacterium necrophorum subsp. funduliforme]KYL00284.1 hypothetical protein A2J06_05990 [Fusobacterium necrophorum subsp. funduliforme]